MSQIIKDVSAAAAMMLPGLLLLILWVRWHRYKRFVWKLDHVIQQLDRITDDVPKGTELPTRTKPAFKPWYLLAPRRLLEWGAAKDRFGSRRDREEE